MNPSVDIVGPIFTALVPSITAALVGGGGLAIGIGVTVWTMKKGWILFQDLLDDKTVRLATWDYASQMSDYREIAANAPVGSDSDSDGGESWADSREGDHAAAVSYLDRYRSA